MPPVWTRVLRELERKGHTMAWLASRLECSEQRVYNWQKRDVPASAYPEVAAVLGKSLDWLAGNEAPASTSDDLSPMALRLAHEFDRISDDAAQLAAFSHCIGVIARAAGGASEPPLMRPAPPPSAGPGPSR